MIVRLVLVALLLGTFPALAFDTSKLGQFGTLPFDDLAPLIAKSAPLQQEINKALSEANKKQDDVRCLGMRFPRVAGATSITGRAIVHKQCRIIGNRTQPV